jgi:hypothetical protein
MCGKKFQIWARAKSIERIDGLEYFRDDKHRLSASLSRDQREVHIETLRTIRSIARSAALVLGLMFGA